MFRGITLHSTLSCNTILCSKSSAWKQEDFCIAIKYIFKTLNFFGLPLKKASFLLMHYSIVIYIYIFIYTFFLQKKKSSHLQWTSVTSTGLSKKIGTGDAPMGEKGLQPSITCQGSSEMTWHSAGQGQQF